MPTRDIVIYPDTVLKTPARPITDIDESLLTLIGDMEKTLYTAPGVGLAAPQVGAPLQLILVDETAKQGSGQLITLLNPVIKEREGGDSDAEMCLSVPEVSVNVKRATHILVSGMDLQGKEHEFEAEGFLARIFQHEIDHLHGKVILDYASSLKRNIYLKKRRKGTL